jgi:hypothetical protein
MDGAAGAASAGAGVDTAGGCAGVLAAGRAGAATVTGRWPFGWATVTGGRVPAAGGTVTGLPAGRATGLDTATPPPAVRCGCGLARAAASAFLRSRMARIASPGFEMLPRLKLGSGREVLLDWLPRELGFLKYSRTRSAWSASMELEWVLPLTPIASSASRIGLLLTSSSRARSLILTLLIRPFIASVPRRLAVHTSLVRSGSRCLSYYP